MPAWRLGVPTCSSRLLRSFEQASEQRNTVDHNSGIMTECVNDSNDARARSHARRHGAWRGTGHGGGTGVGADRHWDRQTPARHVTPGAV